MCRPREAERSTRSSVTGRVIWCTRSTVLNFTRTLVPLLRGDATEVSVRHVRCTSIILLFKRMQSVSPECTRTRIQHLSFFYSFCSLVSVFFIVLWDGLNKKKLTTLPPFPTSISTLAFSPDGTELAIASSYTFEDGERAHPRDEIYVRKVLDHECRPKSKE
jgi:WD40 repeat protein